MKVFVPKENVYMCNHDDETIGGVRKDLGSI